MNKFHALLNQFVGINWRTTILGVGVIVAASSRFGLAFRSKNYDFTALADDGQLIVTTLGGILGGFGLLKAKDQNVIGSGTTATTVSDDGLVKNRDGEIVDVQPTVKKEVTQE